jgi:hypothetical protein
MKEHVWKNNESSKNLEIPEIGNMDYRLSEKEAKIIIHELQNGTRAWFLKGKFYTKEGYTICPIKKDGADSLLLNNNISKFITEKEARNLINGEYCQNKKDYKIVFDILDGKRN